MSGVQLYIYPLTLGKSLIVSKLVAAMGVKPHMNADSMRALYDIMYTVINHRDIAIRLIAYYTLRNDAKECCNMRLIENRVTLLQRKLKIDDIVTLILTIFTRDNADKLLKDLGIEKDCEKQRKIYEVKNESGDSRTISYGGHSIYGLMLDKAAERYGWTKDYIMWGIDLTSLRLMLADSVTSIYLSKDEMRKAGVSDDNTRINMDDAKTAWEFIKSRKWS